MRHLPPPRAFEVFFDGQCPVCKKEIDLIRRKDADSGNLQFTDIAATDFDPGSYQKMLDEFHREIHGLDENGEWVTGVDVFREIYHRLGFVRLVNLSRIPGVRSILQAGYRAFAFVR